MIYSGESQSCEAILRPKGLDLNDVSVSEFIGIKLVGVVKNFLFVGCLVASCRFGTFVPPLEADFGRLF